MTICEECVHGSKQSVCVCYWKMKRKRLSVEDGKDVLFIIIYYWSNWLTYAVIAFFHHSSCAVFLLFVYFPSFVWDGGDNGIPTFLCTLLYNVVCCKTLSSTNRFMCVNGSEMWLSSISETYKFVYQTQSHHLLQRLNIEKGHQLLISQCYFW